MEETPEYYRVLSGIENGTKKGETLQRLSLGRYFAEKHHLIK